VLDEKEQELPSGTVGELCVRSPSVMGEYLGQPEMTTETLAGGWLHTGDLGYIDTTGRIFIVDRKKDMIVSGGFNVYPREVEDALSTHPAVSSSAVYGVPDHQWGEAVWASVVLRADTAVDADTLIGHVRQIKGPLLAPKRIIFTDSLPTTPLGKVDKRALRAPHWEGRSRAVS
jgi:fatty-acyl-CoA synthase